jgi:hypothetical protein
MLNPDFYKPHNFSALPLKTLETQFYYDQSFSCFINNNYTIYLNKINGIITR